MKNKGKYKMWWNKKEVKEDIKPKESEAKLEEAKDVKLEKPKSIMYERIEKLYRKVRYLKHNGFYESKLGNRIFQIIKTYDDDPIYRNCQYCGFNICRVTMFNPDKIIPTIIYLQNQPTMVYLPEKIFSLDVYENNIKIEPRINSLTAHEIDLAILEFENYIETIYQEHKAKIKELEG